MSVTTFFPAGLCYRIEYCRSAGASETLYGRDVSIIRSTFTHLYYIYGKFGDDFNRFRVTINSDQIYFSTFPFSQTVEIRGLPLIDLSDINVLRKPTGFLGNLFELGRRIPLLGIIFSG